MTLAFSSLYFQTARFNRNKSKTAIVDDLEQKDQLLTSKNEDQALKEQIQQNGFHGDQL